MSDVFVPETASAFRQGVVRAELNPWIDKNLLDRAAAENMLPMMFRSAWLRLNAYGEAMSACGAVCMLYVNVWIGIGLMFVSLFVGMRLHSKWTARLGYAAAVDVQFYMWATRKQLLAATRVPPEEQTDSRRQMCESIVFNLDLSTAHPPRSSDLFWPIASIFLSLIKLILGGLLCAKSWTLGLTIDGVLCGLFGAFFVVQSLVRLPTMLGRR